MNFFGIAFILYFLNLSYVSRFWKNLQSDNLELYQRATLSEFPIFLTWNCKMDVISIYQKDTYTGLNANCTSFVPWNHHTIWISSLVTGYNLKPRSINRYWWIGKLKKGTRGLGPVLKCPKRVLGKAPKAFAYRALWASETAGFGKKTTFQSFKFYCISRDKDCWE